MKSVGVIAAVVEFYGQPAAFAVNEARHSLLLGHPSCLLQQSPDAQKRGRMPLGSDGARVADLGHAADGPASPLMRQQLT